MPELTLMNPVMKRIHLIPLFAFVLVQGPIWAQTQELLNPSDPTQLYSFAEIAGGLFYDNEDQGGEGLSWQTGLNLSLAHKFFRINARIPFTNATLSSSLMGDVELGVDAVLHRNNDGFYRSSMIGFNAKFPSSNDGTFILPNWNGLWEVSGSYTGSLSLNSKWSLYPSLKIFHKRGIQDNVILWNQTGFDYNKLAGLESNGAQISLNFSYHKGGKSFIQLRPSWQMETWTAAEQEAAGILDYYNSSQRGLGFNFHYQYAVSPSFQPSIRVDVMDLPAFYGRGYAYRFQVFMGLTYYM